MRRPCRHVLIAIAFCLFFLEMLGASQSCLVDGYEFEGVLNYHVGEPYAAGSIYADCVRGNATCYHDDGFADTADFPVPCENVKVKNRHRHLGVFIKSELAWPRRVVCLDWSDSFPAKTQSHLIRAFSESKIKTDITYIHVNKCQSMYGTKANMCNQCRTAVKITRASSGCQATTGFRSDVPSLGLNLDDRCATYATVLHQLGHIVGLKHEHSHPHRQVIDLRENVHPGLAKAYAIVRNLKNLPYDWHSIMHYNNASGMLCVPQNDKLKYCDITETEVDGCVVPTKKHCDTRASQMFGRSTSLMPSDVAASCSLTDHLATPSTSDWRSRGRPWH